MGTALWHSPHLTRNRAREAIWFQSMFGPDNTKAFAGCRSCSEVAPLDPRNRDGAAGVSITLAPWKGLAHNLSMS